MTDNERFQVRNLAKQLVKFCNRQRPCDNCPFWDDGHGCEIKRPYSWTVDGHNPYQG